MVILGVAAALAISRSGDGQQPVMAPTTEATPRTLPPTTARPRPTSANTATPAQSFTLIAQTAARTAGFTDWSDSELRALGLSECSYMRDGATFRQAVFDAMTWTGMASTM